MSHAARRRESVQRSLGRDETHTSDETRRSKLKAGRKELKEEGAGRERVSGPGWAVFVDRDGTIIEETGYLSDPKQVTILPGTAAALRRLNALGIPVIVISNQSGVARGMFTVEDVERVNQRIRDLLALEHASLDAFYFCTHHPDFDIACDCRKPRPGLLIAASREFRVSLPDSFMVGDKLIDLQAGKAAGTTTIFVRTGEGERELKTARDIVMASAGKICADLSEAVEWIFEKKNPAK